MGDERLKKGSSEKHMKSKNWNVLGFVAVSAALLTNVGGCRSESGDASSAQSEAPVEPLGAAGRIFEIKANSETDLRTLGVGHDKENSVCKRIPKGTTIRFLEFPGDGFFMMSESFTIITLTLSPNDRAEIPGSVMSPGTRVAVISTVGAASTLPPPDQGVFRPQDNAKLAIGNCFVGKNASQSIVIKAPDFDFLTGDGTWMPLAKIPQWTPLSSLP